jgi:hypothetical protein
VVGVARVLPPSRDQFLQLGIVRQMTDEQRRQLCVRSGHRLIEAAAMQLKAVNDVACQLDLDWQLCRRRRFG